MKSWNQEVISHLRLVKDWGITQVFTSVFLHPKKVSKNWLLQKKLAGQGLFNGLLEAKAWTHLETHLGFPIWSRWMETATCKALPGANDMDNDKNALYAMKLSDCWDFSTVKGWWK